jgi:glycosyltransferase involved in cell wall biosynthesis
MSDASPRATVVVPAFNEERSLGSTLAGLHEAFKQSHFEDFEILVVDDGSSDRTAAVAEEWSQRSPQVRLVRHPINQGLGEAYRTAIATARGDLLAVFPADGQFDAADLVTVVEAGQTHDLVLGDLDVSQRPAASRLLHWIEWRLVGLLLGPMPPVHGLFAFRRDLVVGLPLASRGRGWQVVTEIVARLWRQGASCVRVRTRLHPRAYGSSRAISLSAIWSNASQLFAVRTALRSTPRRNAVAPNSRLAGSKETHP